MKRVITILIVVLLSTMVAQGQIKIGGNVYGGGNQGNVDGSTNVRVRAGDINKVFGGARMANVGGNTLVNIDGANATAYMLINYVFGGNDIAGTIGTAAAVGEPLPIVLQGNPDGVDDTWNSYIHLSTKLDGESAATDAKKIFIGQLFAGGNGDYHYKDDEGEHKIYMSKKAYDNGDAPIATNTTGFNRPELAKTYLDIQGGTIFFAHGGGNNATVTEKTIIHVDNPSTVVTSITNTDSISEGNPTGELLNELRIKDGMGIKMAQEHVESDEFQIGRLFGGNNKAEMAIRPTWNLQAGLIRNLYSGGNRGKMTAPEGLLLEIDPLSTNTNPLIIDNVYGGCRMADVIPTVNGNYTPCKNLTRANYPDAGLTKDYHFPNDLSARVLVRGGDINNIYGGNDVTGTVYGGNALGIYTSIRGDVYGGGNGGYAYTNMETLEDDETYGDFYYNTQGHSTTIDALNAFRPNAEQVSILLAGNGPGSNMTLIRGSVFVGGNCASLATKKSNPLVELKIGSYVIADKVFLGNNGEKMVDPDILALYANNDFSNLTLTDKTVFANYMEGVAMTMKPNIVFENTANGDPASYETNSSFVGSFYCGGNVGSMAIDGKETFTINQRLNIFEKFVGGCKNANVAEGTYNAAYDGGIIGSKNERGSSPSTFYTDTGAENGNIRDRLEINLENMTIVPLRWNDTKNGLIWNTQKYGDIYTAVEDGTTLTEGNTYYTSDRGAGEFTSDGTEVANGTNYFVKEDEQGFYKVPNSPIDKQVRLMGGNVYGGCYESGHVNGNVTININEDVLKRDEVFGAGIYGNPASGVELEDQRDDLMAVALTVFGAGFGENTEIWGSTTINHNNGYALQIFGGGEKGVVGKKVDIVDEDGAITQKYQFDKRYSTTVNLNGIVTATSDKDTFENLAEAEFIYGGGNEGDVCGNTLVNLGNGRIYDAFGGACDANILGHSEVYIGRQPNSSGGYQDGFPWIQDIVYGGNDFGGTIFGDYEDGYNFEARLRDYATDKTQLYGYKADVVPNVLKSSTYVEYNIGHVDSIFGGGYGYYNYKNTELYGSDAAMPVQHSSYVNIRPKDNSNNHITAVFGGGTGYPGNRANDGAQDRSYVLIDIPDGITKFSNMEVFGAGSYNGLGMRYTFDNESGKTVDDEGQAINLDEASAIIDLLHGHIHNAYGGSFNEGITRRTVVNVPTASTIQIDSIFGGAYGTQILPPCDVYETQVNYKNTSENAQVFGAIFGGNNRERRSLYTQVNISAPVWSNKAKGYTGTVYGAGRGIDTWSEHTEVNLLSGAKVYNVYGGGELGHVLNTESVQQYMWLYREGPSPQIATQDPNWNERYKTWTDAWKDAWTLGSYFMPNTTTWATYLENAATNLSRISNRAELDDKTAALLHGKKYNTNVIVNQGAVVEGYVYGGGLGDASEARTGDIYGSTYVAVLGGEVKKDVYAGGRAGGLDNLFSSENFTANSNVYIQGGTVRNVYGGGYLGHVGYHVGDIDADYTGDRLAETNIVIGKTGTNTFEGGAPAITRNVYGGGEGGSVYGNSKITLNNGYIGYRYKNTGSKYEYVEELDDQKTNDIETAGNIFGGGYVVNSYVDNTRIDMYGGQVRGCLYGGGEVGPIGRGANKTGLGKGMENEDATIFRAGTTQVNMYDGKVLRNVFGGGRGKDSWGGDGTLYMDKAVVNNLKANGFWCKGYVFGQTRVNIYGGEIGTEEGMAHGYGNVFGGCDEGVVYSAYMFEDDELRIGKKAGVRYNKGLSPEDDNYNYQGYYYQYDKEDGFITHNVAQEGDPEKLERSFTEDCKVLVEPHCLAYVDIDGTSYKAGDYVPTSYLNTLKDKNTAKAVWDKLDPDGIIIHNAVFAGGNIAAGSSSLFANATTVYGNATASIHDVYNRDLITIGTGHTGGLYGDGNLTFVDGYRELNITNYGTDYYHIEKQLSYDVYKDLPEREKAYYELKYKVKDGVGSVTDNAGTTYSEGSNLPQDEILVLFAGTDKILDGKPNPAFWQENGVVSVYAGRIMNTIQRADFCGVFGSRMVMKGAQDRVPEEVDYTNYTINRVREVSLNKMDSKAGDMEDNAIHGNYFGIYSVVNYLGALTSDVKFDDVRITNRTETDLKGDGSTTYYQWKSTNIRNKKRNNGTCHNHLALASGVYLELTTEMSTGNKLDEKDWGPITGIVELDLINVQPGMGGGFVYARNQHGTPSETNNQTTTLTLLNEGAATQWDYSYATPDESRHEWQTSGNFIHSSQTIIDDCYNISNRYLNANGVPAHYWYIAGTVYVYDQYISAYTGSPNAYSEVVELPITINAASHGTMTLMDVQPNLYAFYSNYTDASNNIPLKGDQKLVINDVTYQLNTPISYWDWNKLPAAEKLLFVSDTYVVIEDCKIGAKEYAAGTVLLKSEYEDLISEDITTGNPVYPTVTHKRMVDGEDQDVEVPFTDVFRSSNNMSHTTGYLLTYNVTNPSIWNTWYTKVVNTESGVVVSDQTGGADYEDGPTYHPTVTGLYGQQDYALNAIISKNDFDKYNGYDANSDGDYIDEGDVYGLKQMYPAISSHDDQATFVPAYLVTKECTDDGQHYYPGAPVSAAIGSSTAPAYISTATIQLSPTEYIYVNDLMTEAQKNAYKTAYGDVASLIESSVVPAYYCTTAGKYGGSYYETDKNYRALEAYSAMSPDDRQKFAFNYDALDLLIDPNYGGTTGKKYQYDGMSYDHVVTEGDKNVMTYSLTKPIDYTATYNSNSSLDLGSGNNITVNRGGTPTSTSVIQKNDELLGPVYESLPNERHYYAPIQVDAKGGTYYVVKESFVHGERPYAVGSTIESDTYDRLSDSEKTNYITILTFDEADVAKDGSGNPLPLYYCREGYTINSSYYTSPLTGAVTSIKGVEYNTSENGNNVPAGIVISAEDYSNLINKQLNFTIHGVSPMETSTLFVSRNADINDLSTEKIITVIYKYDYEESDADGTHITPVSERHVVNIHINFKSGVPTVEDINPPTIVLPGTGITMRLPSVTPGAYEVTGGGWELFETKSNAESHVNGVEYTPNSDPLYWYQDGFYLAYYARTYLGKTYSNHVPVSVANYHDLKEVMDDKTYHLHVDYDRTHLKRDSKIYINNYSSSGQNGLDLFKDFYDLSLVSGTGEGYTVTDGKITGATGSANSHLVGHAQLNISEATGTNIYDQTTTNVEGVKSGMNLEFFLRSDIDHSPITEPNPDYDPENPTSPETITVPRPWTPIGTDDICFKGTLHGDGHTISGLDHSLFYNLCGNVYNLGVSGSFNTAGVVDKGTGYVESAWVKTTNKTPLGTKPYAVFGNPTDANGYQVVNSYFWDGNESLYNMNDDAITSGGARGKARAMTTSEFYNGTVAYDLNNFYLHKRYTNKNGTEDNTNKDDRYYTIGIDGNLTLQPYKRYENRPDLCSSGWVDAQDITIKYVEDRFADGDFRYAAGEIPETEDERRWIDTEDNNQEYFYPIWPDDYIFFGQKLTYGWASKAHQDVPTAVVRDGGRLSDEDDANRVYRAPAYFRSKTMGMTHFNPDAYLAQKSFDGTKMAYPQMTAIDFADHKFGYDTYNTYGLGLVDVTIDDRTSSMFYPPLLDDDGLTSIENCDETQNLLVYAPAETAESGYTNKKTHDVLAGYFTEPVYDDHYDNTKGYRRVAEATTANVHGHLVHLVKSNLKATNDHLLVDKQDFNAPLAYDFDEDHRMWYQRTPANDEYVTHGNTGWQGISVPFTAELVTTNNKGEITHFYNGSDESLNNTHTKKGHEYWLREFNKIKEETVNETTVAKATFNYPNATSNSKTVTNTFLWDYYYKNESVHNQLDENTDTYLEYRQYYKEPRPTYTGYPLLTAATPYILGLPGKTYYEFDLSGKFTPQNTAVSITRLEKQIITLASETSEHIAVSDNEMNGKSDIYNSTNYTFKPSYMNEELGTDAYVLNSDGNAYCRLSANDETNATNKVKMAQSAFRPYFIASASGSARQMLPDHIIFGNDVDGMEGEPISTLDGDLELYVKGHKIVATSHLTEATTVRIINASGVTITDFVLMPGETKETPITIDGVYIVNKKKLLVK